MAAASITTPTLSLCFSSSVAASKRCVSFSSFSLFSSVPILSTWKGRVLAAVVSESVERQNDDVFGDDDNEEEEWRKPRATEVYVCNLPRSIDSEYLFDLFHPHGNVLSVEVCRNAETGRSKGCAYVTLGSIVSARNAVSALDGMDVGGREMRVRFSVEMNRGLGRNLQTMNSSPKQVLYYEGPYKLYVGNLPKATRPEELRYLFDQFGNVVSVRILKDRKEGISRVFAFLSFLSEGERSAAMSLHGTEFGGRTLVVREGVDRN